MSDSGESIRGSQDSDLEWMLRLRRVSDARSASFDLTLAAGDPSAIGEIRDAVLDAARYSVGDINPYDDEVAPIMPDLATAQHLLAVRDAAVMAGDPDAVVQELSFGLSQHIIDIAQGNQAQPPHN